MSIKKSFMLTFSVQVYSTIITIALTPLLISMVGAEGFGLIGFFLILQNLIQILDAGISGTLSRQIAITKHCRKAFKVFLLNFNKVYVGFIILASCFFLLSYFFRGEFSSFWFDTSINKSLLDFCLLMMAGTLAIKYLSGPLRSGLVGLESHYLIAIVNFISATLRYPGGIFVLFLFQNSLSYYFAYQLLVSIFEWAALQFFFYSESNKVMRKASQSNVIEAQSLKSLLLLSLQLSVLSILWVIVSQIDKLLLSGVMELEKFGYYSLAVSVSGVILTLNIPLNQVLMPRLASFASNKLNAEYAKFFTGAFTYVAVFFIPLSVVLFFFGKELVWAWTGDEKAANDSYVYIKWLALGNVIAVLMNFSFLLQFTIKRLRQHIIAYGIYSALLVPITIYVVNVYKGEGAAFFWFVHNALFFVIWGGYTFRVYLKNALTLFIIPISLIALLISYIVITLSLSVFDFVNMKRIYTFLSLGFIGLASVVTISLILYFLRFYYCCFLKKVTLTQVE